MYKDAISFKNKKKILKIGINHLYVTMEFLFYKITNVYYLNI